MNTHKLQNKKRLLGWRWLNSGGGADFQSSVTLTANVTESQQFVTLPKLPGIADDFSNVEFVMDPDGSGSEKLFLWYDLVSYDGSNGYFKVSSWPGFTASVTTFKAIWGPSIVSRHNNAYVCALTARLVHTEFARTPRYDVQNVFAGADYLLDGPGNASQEVNWSATAQWPVFQANWGKWVNSDWEKVYVAYKYDAIDNIHAGSPTSKSALKYTKDFTPENMSARQYIYDPDEGYITTSTDSKAIPTSHPTAVSFNVAETDRLWQVGDIARVKATAGTGGTHYFWMQITSYSGGVLQGNSLSHSGTGTFSAWAISQRFGATNTVITIVKKTDGVLRVVAGFTKYDFYNLSLRVNSSYRDLDSNGDFTGSWSTPVQIGPNSWANIGGKALTTHDGRVWIPMHENAVDTTEYYSTVAYSDDYGVTWGYLRTTHYPGAVLLDETDLLQVYDDSLQPTFEIRATCRNEESATTSNHQYKYKITWTAGNVPSSSNIEENDWYDSTVSRYTSGRCPDLKTVFWGGGDATGKMVFSPDNLRSFHPVPVATLYTSAYSARRVYYTFAFHPDGRAWGVWSSNKQPNGSDLFINFFDWTRNSFYQDSLTTLTDYSGVNNRPIDLDPGLRLNGSLVPGYRSTSDTSNSIPTGAGQQRTFTTETGLSWQAGDAGVFMKRSNNAVRFTFTVVSYNSGNGQIVVEWASNTTTGTHSDWAIEKTSNHLANQYLVSRVVGNGQVRPLKITMTVKTNQSGLGTSGVFGLKRFEARAAAVITISDAGSAGDVISIKWRKSGTYSALFGGMGIVATYTVQGGDNIAAVVAGLVADARERGVALVNASDSTTLTLTAPLGNNTAINGQSYTVETTGTVAGSSGTFSGGAAIELSTAFQNIITIDNPNNVFRAEQANDNFTSAFTVNDGPATYTFEWDSSSASATDGTTTKSKGSGDGSGVPNWEGHLIFGVTNAVSSFMGFLEFTQKLTVEPKTQTPATVGSLESGSWNLRADGYGLN